MKRLLPHAPVTTTSVAFAALCAGAGVANAAGCSQKTCFGGARPRNDNRLQPGEPLGASFENGVPSGFRTRAQIWPRFIR
jgi:hypothetical protein